MDEPTNPYATPQSLASASDVVLETQATTLSRIVPAGKGLRFANLIIDYIAQGIVGFGVGIAIGVIGGDAAIQALQSVPDIVVGLPILLMYYIVCEATTGRTLGKVLTGTKVVDADGGPPTFGQIVGRSFARLIPFEAFSFFGTPTRGWHDSLPKTWVVKA